MSSSEDSDISQSDKNGIITECDIEESRGNITLENGTVISWDFDWEYKCCEKFGAYRSSKSISPEDMIGKVLINFDTEYRGSDKCSLIIRTTGGKYIHKFYNHHSGYYSHTLSVYQNGEMVLSNCL